MRGNPAKPSKNKQQRLLNIELLYLNIEQGAISVISGNFYAVLLIKKFTV